MAEDLDFDLAAAGLRADDRDMRVTLEVLASKLEQTLPGHVQVERRGGGLLSRGPQRVRRLRVELGAMRYELAVEGERIEGFRQREVGGISIKRDALDPQAWVTALAEDLRVEAQRSGEARRALEGLSR